MRDYIEGKKLLVSKLLNIFSIEKIIAIFNEIDERILQLIKCSSDDFIHLNANFRNLHHAISQISSDALRVFDILENNQNNILTNKVLSNVTSLSSYIDKLEDQIVANKSVHDELARKLDYLFIPVNNFYQNLNTLKLLSANLKLDPFLQDNSDKLNASLHSVFISYPDMVDRLKKLRKFINNSYNTLESIKTNYFKTVNNIINYCSSTADFILTKQTDAKSIKPDLVEKLKTSNDHTSLIITNLQYQDIVKQKIEHVQKAHAEVLKKLTELIEKPEDHPGYNLAKIKLFIQIRDIAHLQAAQLIHANHKYQDALEIITSKFLELGESFKEIFELCQRFRESTVVNQLPPSEIDLNNRKVAGLLNETDAINTIYKLQIESVVQQVTKFSTGYKNLVSASQELRQVIGQITGSDPNKVTSAKPDIYKEIETVSGELMHIIENLESVGAENLKTVNTLEENYKNQYISPRIETSIRMHTKNLVESFNELIVLNRDTFQIVNSEVSPCNITVDINNSLEEVKYYSLFNHEIEIIIDNLREISEKLHMDTSQLSMDEISELEDLKVNYTMESEFIIHDYFVEQGKAEGLDLINKAVEHDQNVDENNLELF